MERAPSIFYRKSPWDGVSITDFFLSRHACGDRDEKLRGWSHPPHLRPNEGRYDDLTKTGNCAWKVSGTQARSMCEWALYHIFPLSMESVVNTERAPGCPEAIDDADKKWGGLFVSRQDSESLSHNHHRWFFPSRWRTEKENFLFPG